MTRPKTPPEPRRSAALSNSQLGLIYYIVKFSLNSLEVRGHPFEGCLYISIISIMWCPQGGWSASLFIAYKSIPTLLDRRCGNNSSTVCFVGLLYINLGLFQSSLIWAHSREQLGAPLLGLYHAIWASSHVNGPCLGVGPISGNSSFFVKLIFFQSGLRI